MKPIIIADIRKALVAVAAALAILAVALTAASEGGTSVTPSEWVQIAIAALGALGVYSVKNG